MQAGLAFSAMLGNFMKRAFLAIICGTALMASTVAAVADVVSDREMADRYSQAAQSGDTDAQFYLGALYSAGVGRPRSDEEAFQWFSRAADHGHSHAMLVLAGMYAVGRGAPVDNFKAYKWAYIVSVGSRVDEFRNGSRQLIGVLDTRLTREEIDKAKVEADRWRAVPSQAKAAAPADALTRDSTAAQSSTGVSKQAPDNTASGSVDSPRVSGIKKNDLDALLNQVPSGLRKRFGF
jgi:TPR repeat protein